MRNLKEELELRTRQRKDYFEDPNYRKWSDISPTPTIYGSISECSFFRYYISGNSDTETDLPTMISLLENGKQLPIDWKALYEYFDIRYNDDDNYALDEFYYGVYGPGEISGPSIASLLKEYRSKLTDDYDIV